VVDSLGAGAVEADVVRGPAGAELCAADRELSDEVRQATIVGVATGFGAQMRDEVAGDALPVG
jgi:hypothetical protein